MKIRCPSCRSNQIHTERHYASTLVADNVRLVEINGKVSDVIERFVCDECGFNSDDEGAFMIEG